MANRRSSPQTSTASSPPLARKKYPLRRSPPARKRGGNSRAVSTASHPPARASISSPESRPVLVPLQPNLRRLPSRTTLTHKGESDMRVAGHSDADAKIGTKRKRVATTNENSVGGGRTTRGAGRPKRLKRNSGQRMDYTSEESDASEMEIDRWNSSHNSESDRGEEDEDGVEKTQEESDDDDDDQSSDDYLINSAQPKELLRLRKDELVRLYSLAGLCDDAEQFTKSEIVDAIITARDDVASLPPSSPPGQGNSSDYSSDDGHFGDTGLEESRHPSTRPGLSATLRRRATTNDYGGRLRAGKLKGRSLSMGTLHGDAEVAEAAAQSCKRNSKQASQNSVSRRRTQSRPSPVPSTSAAAIFHSPPANRTRSRKVSAEVINCESISTPISNFRKTTKGKGKQVEFDDQVQPKTPSMRTRGRSAPSVEMEEESDLTELEDLEQNMREQQPSPRRLRSKDRARETGIEDHPQRRITPMRKAKGRVVSLKESDTDELMDDDEEGSDEEEEEEVDELISTATPSPVSSRVERTPMRRRLRSGQKEQESASDGDDEQEAEQDEASDDEAEENDDEATIAVEPRRLRNGKIVGEEDDAEMEVIEEDVDEQEVEDEGIDVEEVDVDAEGDTEEEQQEEDEETIEDDEVDLTIATTKTLVRLRRDDLVRLCEARDLEPAGTKPQLAEALLQWRDRQEISSKSSTGTIRPPSTVRRARRRLRDSGATTTPPVLLRSDHVLPDEPDTPQVPQEPELELDLGNLGLEDREIPPEKLQKLEKIGSGGFKDVFIGKFKGRKIAISEFRGQLTSMDIKELKLLGGFDHPNIVRFIGVSIPENTKEVPVMIVSELCSNGDLFDYIRNVNPPSLHKVLMIMLDIARGVEYLHLRKPSVIHRDCKSSNILITSRGTAKIADFGLAKVKQSTRSMVRSLVGTVNWQAPELWHAHPKYNHKVDVFSCAMVYWEMLQWHQPTKKFPWEGMNEHAIYEIVGTKRQRPSITGLKKQWCTEIVALIEKMWAHEHEQRPTMSEVVTELEDLVKRY